MLAPRLIRAGLVPEGEEIMNAVARTYPSPPARSLAFAHSTPAPVYVCTRTYNGRESRNFFIITGGGTNTRAPVAV